MAPRKDVDSDEDVYSSDDGGKGKSGSKDKEPAYAWEASYTRSWDQVQEDEGGSLQTAVEDLLARSRRRLLAAPDGAIRRTIIRHLILVLDLSAAMLDRDMRPTRFDLALQTARAFVAEWFDQNPLGQVGVVGMRAGLGERVGEMTGNPQDVLKALSERHKLEPEGEPSLQNALEMARTSMNHLPTHASREIVVLFGSLTTVDPGAIHETLEACVRDRIRVSVVALAAEMKVCREFANRTGGTFGVALNEGHFRDLLFELIPPPAQQALPRTATAASSTSGAAPADLMLMGFPTRLPDTAPPALCACHAALRRAGYVCPRCKAKLCAVPTDCDVCGLMLVSAPHLARSYHHLFPVKAYVAVMEFTQGMDKRCYACGKVFRETASTTAIVTDGVSPLGRYACTLCTKHFCGECDVFVHDVVHVCPGCGR